MLARQQAVLTCQRLLACAAAILLPCSLLLAHTYISMPTPSDEDEVLRLHGWGTEPRSFTDAHSTQQPAAPQVCSEERRSAAIKRLNADGAMQQRRRDRAATGVAVVACIGRCGDYGGVLPRTSGTSASSSSSVRSERRAGGSLGVAGAQPVGE